MTVILTLVFFSSLSGLLPSLIPKRACLFLVCGSIGHGEYSIWALAFQKGATGWFLKGSVTVFFWQTEIFLLCLNTWNFVWVSLEVSYLLNTGIPEPKNRSNVFWALSLVCIWDPVSDGNLPCNIFLEIITNYVKFVSQYSVFLPCPEGRGKLNID